MPPVRISLQVQDYDINCRYTKHVADKHLYNTDDNPVDDKLLEKPSSKKNSDGKCLNCYLALGKDKRILVWILLKNGLLELRIAL